MHFHFYPCEVIYCQSPLWTKNRLHFFTTTASSNVSIIRYRMSLVTILLLDFVMIHWIQRRLFRESQLNGKSTSMTRQVEYNFCKQLSHVGNSDSFHPYNYLVCTGKFLLFGKFNSKSILKRRKLECMFKKICKMPEMRHWIC